MEEKTNKEQKATYRSIIHKEGPQIHLSMYDILLKKMTKRKVSANDDYSFIVPWQQHK